jgi:hypothetical protein
VPQTQKIFEWLANAFFPVLMSAHEGFTCCDFAYRRPVIEILMIKQEKRMNKRMNNVHAHFYFSFLV